jgi:hypothetical protein
MKPTDVLASFLAKVRDLVGTQSLGPVSRAVIFIRSDEPGPNPPAIVLTYPLQSEEATIAELEAALAWMRGPPDAPAPTPLPTLKGFVQ